MQELILIALGGVFYRVRGGLGNETARKLLGKPEGWEIPNRYIRAAWALFLTCLFPWTFASPILFGLFFLGASIGYLGGEFNLALRENRTWENYLLLSVRGALICLPALCLYPLYPSLLGGVLAGALMPICFLIGFTIPEIKGRISHSQWGELLIGATVTGGILWIS